MTGGGSGERTLTAAILPPKTSHLVTAISTEFRNHKELTEFAGLSASIVYDFFIKVIGCGAIHASRVESFPLGIADKIMELIIITEQCTIKEIFRVSKTVCIMLFI